MPSTLPSLVRFGNFEVDLRAGELRREGSRVRLQEQPFLLLTVLLESAGEVVTREELRKRLWAEDTFVDFDHRLAVAVSKLRDALRDSAENPKFVETVGRRGYRFLGQLEFTDSLSADSGARMPDSSVASYQLAEQAELPKLAHLQPRRFRVNRLIFLSTVGFAILLAAVTLTRLVRIRSRKEPSSTPRSLAILPLQNRGEDSRSDFLGLSLADVLITKLAYVSSLSVRPSAAIEKYRGTAIDLQKVAADLNVDTLLTGSFIRDGNNLRITYQLVDAKSEKILGQGVIDLKYDNLLAVQDKVTGQLISELQLNLSPVETEHLKSESSVSPLAYEYFLQGLDLYGQHKFPLAIQMFEKTTEIDPNYAQAWAYLGASYNSDAAFLPEVPFARVLGRNMSCKEIGGDFFEAVNTPEGLAVVLADVSGKGVSAALLASILQGMVYSQLISGMPLTEIVAAVNRFFTYKHIGEKYATMIITRLRNDGDLEYVNCGHIPPVWICGNEVLRPSHGNLPVGLLADATYSSDRCQMKAGDRLILVTDGVTEAENARGDMFDSERLERVAGKSQSMEDIFSAVADFCGGTPLNDDCTVVELAYTGD